MDLIDLIPHATVAVVVYLRENRRGASSGFNVAREKTRYQIHSFVSISVSVDIKLVCARFSCCGSIVKDC